jgi:hypothetical protein
MDRPGAEDAREGPFSKCVRRRSDRADDPCAAVPVPGRRRGPAEGPRRRRSGPALSQHGNRGPGCAGERWHDQRLQQHVLLLAHEPDLARPGAPHG